VTGDDAALALAELRGERRFVEMRRRAEELVGAFPDHATLRRQLAQSLIELGQWESARLHLERVVDRAPDDERREAIGLLGRIEKQRFVHAGGVAGPTASGALASAVRSYSRVWSERRAAWHGVNVLALTVRARREGIEVPEATPVETLAEEVAAAAGGDVWREAILMETRLAVGDLVGALRHARAYVAGEADAFAVGGTLRQLREIWFPNPGDPHERELIAVLEGGLARRAGGLEGLPEAIDLRGANTTLGELEANSPPEDFYTVDHLRTGLARARAVGRVDDGDGRRVGTGFLVWGRALHPTLPDEPVLVSNFHVLNEKGEAVGGLQPIVARRAKIVFENAGEGLCARYGVTDVLFERKELDVVVARVAAEARPAHGPESCCPVTDDPPPGKPPRCAIIGHPAGHALSFSLVRNRLHDVLDETWFIYDSPTSGGSSGSPVFSRYWEVVAVHHAGAPQRPVKVAAPDLREGVGIGAIRRAMP
jgi:hypothetical protein